MKNCFITLLLAFGMINFSATLQALDEFYLKENLKKASKGDYIVTAQFKNYSMLIVKDKTDKTLSIEEITLPASKVSKEKLFSWRQWVKNGSLGNTSQVIYTIDVDSGKILQTYSISRQEYISVSEQNSFLSILLNLKLTKIPTSERKRVGFSNSHSTDDNTLWQPPLIVEGKTIANAKFEAWRTFWPKDGSELSGKTIEVFIPTENDKYPSYFPYWLQMSGLVGKARIRIVDSGTNL